MTGRRRIAAPDPRPDRVSWNDGGREESVIRMMRLPRSWLFVLCIPCVAARAQMACQNGTSRPERPLSSSPFLLIFAVLLGALVILDAFFGFPAARRLFGPLVRSPRRVTQAIRGRIAARRQARERRALIDDLEREIQEWLAREQHGSRER